jgi:4-hydroxybenzoate polyprenyltransferase
MQDILSLIRVKQWVKNCFIFAALIFSKNLFNLSDFYITTIAFIVFCFTSSSVYVFNDIIDCDKDKLYEKKSGRPIASGRISKINGIIISITLFLLSILITLLVLNNIYFLMIILLYIIVNIAYSLIIKNIEIIDVIVIAIGFVLRVIAGAIIIKVTISPWILICTFFLSLYLGYNKRKNELLLLGKNGIKHRTVLEKYSIEYVNYLVMLTGSACIMAYTLYTVVGTNIKNVYYTIPFVFYAIARYEWLVINKKEGGSPENLIFKDKPFFSCLVLWVISCIAIIYFV